MDIVCWGGCINRQRGLDADKHYHAVLAKQLKEQANISARINFRFYTTYAHLKARAEIVLNGNTAPGIFIIFLRPYPILPLTKILIRYKDKRMRTRFALHPKFWKKSYDADIAEEYNVPIVETKNGSSFYGLFKRLNGFLGDRFRLKEWAANEILEAIKAVAFAAEEKGSKVILLGPPQYPKDLRVNQVCSKLNLKVQQLSKEYNLPSVNINGIATQAGVCLFEDDGIHLNQTGHQLVAEEIFKLITA